MSPPTAPSRGFSEVMRRGFISFSLRDVSRLPTLLRELETLGYNDAALEKIAYGNWLRVLRETWRE